MRLTISRVFKLQLYTHTANVGVLSSLVAEEPKTLGSFGSRLVRAEASAVANSVTPTAPSTPAPTPAARPAAPQVCCDNNISIGLVCARSQLAAPIYQNHDIELDLI